MTDSIKKPMWTYLGEHGKVKHSRTKTASTEYREIKA